MYRKILFYILITVLLILFNNCGTNNADNDNTNPVITVTADGIYEDFEGGNIQKYSWITGGNYIPYVQSDTFYKGQYALRFNDTDMAKDQTAYFQANINADTDVAVTFWYKTDLLTGKGNYFSFSIDGFTLFSIRDYDTVWQQYSYPISKGEHIIKWLLENRDIWNGQGMDNTAWLDNISIIPDNVDYLSLAPDAEQTILVSTDTIVFKTTAYRTDNSIKNYFYCTYAVIPGSGNGTIDNNGIFYGTDPGTCNIIAYSVDKSVTSKVITILDTNFIDDTFTYNNQSFAGMTTILSNDTPGIVTDSNITITKPEYKQFQADGFFVLSGSVNYSGAEQYIQVYITHDTSDSTATYFLNHSFEKRIWLRYGPGDYTIIVRRVILTAENTIISPYDGDITNWSYSNDILYQFNITNTSNVDGLYYFPSDLFQSDNYILMNKAAEITASCTNDSDKIKTVHDWVIKYLYYDDDSLISGKRKKQDAISVYTNKTAVCEGYTNLFNTLLRAVGIKSRYARGFANTDSGQESHAWSEVYYNGEWKFIDTTWDDPGPDDNDPNGYNIRYDYFMLNTIPSDHTFEEILASRAPHF